MGCDIHIFVELRIDGLWYSQGGESAVVHLHRNPLLFAHLAGVRRFKFGVTPIVEPRGVPHDACEATADYMHPSNGLHSHSWLTAVELIRHEWRGPTPATSFDQSDLGDLLYPLVGLALSRRITPVDIRIVFAFDN